MGKEGRSSRLGSKFILIKYIHSLKVLLQNHGYKKILDSSFEMILYILNYMKLSCVERII